MWQTWVPFSHILLSYTLLSSFSTAIEIKAPNAFQVPVNIRPASRVWEPPVDIFKPQDALKYHAGLIENDTMPIKVSEISLAHVNHTYINLEDIEPFLQQGIVNCHKNATPHELTELELNFKKSEHFRLATDQWKSSTSYLFAVEGEDCFMGAGERSFFRSHDIITDTATQKMTIKAMPLMAHFFASNDWRTSLNITHFYLPEGQLAIPRKSSGWTFVDESIARRDDGEHFGIDFDVDLDISLHHPGASASVDINLGNRSYGPAHPVLENFLPKTVGSGNHTFDIAIPRVDLYCLDCRRKGKFKASMSMHFDFSHHHHDQVGHTCLKKRSTPEAPLTLPEKYQVVRPQIEVLLEAERRVKHQKLAQHLQKRCSPGDALCAPNTYVGAPTCPPSDPNWPSCKAITIPKDGAGNHCIHRDNVLLHPVHAVKDMGKCALRTLFAGDNTDCYQKFIDAGNEFQDAGELVRSIMKMFMRDAKVEIEVEEEIDIKFQPMINLMVDLGIWFDLDVYPGAIVPSVGTSVNIGGGSSAIIGVHDGDPHAWHGGKLPDNYMTEGDDGKPKPQVPKPWKGQPANPNPTKGNRNPWKPPKVKNSKDGSTTSNNGAGFQLPWTICPLTLEASVGGHINANITFPGFHFQIAKGGKLTFDALKSDMITNTLDIRTAYLPADFTIAKNETSLTFMVSAGPRFKLSLIPSFFQFAKTAIGDPLAIGAHIQPFRWDYTITKTEKGDTRCPMKDGSTFPGGFHHALYYRMGTSLFARVFFQNFDATWLGMLDKSKGAIRGLWKTFQVFESCHASSHAHGEGEGIIDKLREFLRALQEPIVAIVAEIGPAISQFHHVDYKNETMWTTQDPPRKLFEYGQWRESVFLNDPASSDLSTYYRLDPAWLDPHSAFYWVPELDLKEEELQYLYLESINPGSGILSKQSTTQNVATGQADQLNAIQPGAAALLNQSSDSVVETSHNMQLCAINPAQCSKPSSMRRRWIGLQGEMPSWKSFSDWWSAGMPKSVYARYLSWR